MGRKPTFNPYEEKIVRVLYQAGIALSAAEIAEKTKISWLTVNGYMKMLERKGVVKKVMRGEERALWELNYELLE